MVENCYRETRNGFSKTVFFIVLLCIYACSGGSSGSGGSTDPAFYIDATHGNDASTGRTAANAWQTFANLSAASFSGSTTIYLKRGETWHEQLIVPASNITVTAYGSGPLPVLDGSTLVSDWTDTGNGIYYADVVLEENQALGNICQNNTMMTFLSWTTDTAATFNGAASDTYAYNYATGRIYIKPTTAPDLNTYRASTAIIGIRAVNKRHVTVCHVAIRCFSLHGIQFLDCADGSVSDSDISRVGGAVVAANPSGPPDYIYAGNGVEFANSSTNGRVQQVTVSEIFDSGLTSQTFISDQTASGFIFSDAVIDTCGFAGIEFSVLTNNAATGCRLSDIAVSEMQINASGKGWSGRRYGTEGYGIRIKADDGAGAISGVTVETSTITDSAGSGISISGKSNLVRLHRLKINGNDEHGVAVPEPSAADLRVTLSSSLVYDNNGYGFYYNAPNAGGFDLYHNTFFNNGTIQLAVFHQQGTAHIKNNICFSDAALTHLFVDSVLSDADVNHNCYNNTANMFGYNGTAYSTVEAFSAATGFESEGLGDGVIGLTDPGAGDFSLQTGSDCIGRGSRDTGISTDYAGMAFADPPSCGAIEY